LGAADPLAAPKSLDDVTAILKRDQVTLFAAAITWLGAQDSKDALALHGQIELAWGETYILLVEVIAQLRKELESRATGLRTQGAPDDAARAKLEWIESSSAELALRSAALKLVAIEHIAEGSEKAEALIERHPDSYLGYRLMADYYRTLRDWPKFDEMVARIAEINPKSNGLIFLRGAAAFQMSHDLPKATEQYHQALKNDPQFVRAQAHLLLIQSDLDATHRELLALEKLNPQHQLVVVAGEAIKRAWAEAHPEGQPAS
jgi:tetratricopeptide (TPR) repeat protein